MIDEDLPHRTRGHAKKVGAAAPVGISGADQAQITFVHKRGRLESMIATLPGQMAAGESAKFRVNQRHQFFGRSVIAGAPIVQQSRDLPL